MGDWADDCERAADFREEEALEFLKKVNEAQAAVIEAAKALHAKMNRGEFASTADEQAGVWQAVEALQEVEGE